MISSNECKSVMWRYRFLTSAIILTLMTGCAASPRFTTEQSPHLSKPEISKEESSRSPSVQEGVASYYADEFHGRRTSNGEIYDMHQLTAAHQTLPFNTKVKVTNKTNGRSVIVRINDRGPFMKDRIIDLSLAAAKELEMIGPGTAEVRLEVIEWGDNN